MTHQKIEYPQAVELSQGTQQAGNTSQKAQAHGWPPAGRGLCYG